ncbi:uncharacterized protein LOC128866652 isoform X1 [Anastrepha ludens]|uniref:uncharacterized protein LOC128866652 isoform X1 n=1 Tax=Anastrepha ludens TaxID=28586 RepID=UPI0023B0BBC5|nr:uncharacterized protein LOC128866652 isoform X1 [Anastrepha ludens]
MKAYANLCIVIAMISIIASFGAEGYGMRGGARGLRPDEVQEEIPQELSPRARRAAVDEAPEDVPQEFRERYRRAVPKAVDEAPEQVPQEIEHKERFRRSPSKIAEEAPEEAPKGLHGARHRRSPQMPVPDGMPPMPPMPPMPQ